MSAGGEAEQEGGGGGEGEVFHFSFIGSGLAMSGGRHGHFPPSAYRRRGGLWLYFDFGSDGHPVVEIDHVQILHPHASVAGWRPELRFGVGSVDVNVALLGVRVFGFDAFEPKDPRLDMVFRIAFLPELSGSLATDEDFSRRGAVPNSFRDPEAAGRRFVAARLGPKPETGGGDGITADNLARFIEQIEGLRRNVDANAHARLSREDAVLASGNEALAGLSVLEADGVADEDEATRSSVQVCYD
jgi:hypothetical protein